MIPSLLYSDMDGTLLVGQEVSPENQQALRTFRQAGGAFAPATGRSEVSVRHYVDLLSVNLPVILYNGAAVYDFAQDAFLHKSCLPAETVAYMVQTALRQYPEVCVEAFTGGPTRLLNPKGVEDPFIFKENQPWLASSLTEALDIGCLKLLFYGDPQRLRQLDRVLLAEAPGLYASTYSAPYYFEILPRHATKGDALAWIATYLEKPREQFAAIGDYDNDVTMLEFAGLSAAPADAKPSAKEAADVVVAPHKEHAVADFIHRFLLR